MTRRLQLEQSFVMFWVKCNIYFDNLHLKHILSLNLARPEKDTCLRFSNCVVYITCILYLLMKSSLNSDCQLVKVTDFCLSLFCLLVPHVFQHRPGSVDNREHSEYLVTDISLFVCLVALLQDLVSCLHRGNCLGTKPEFLGYVTCRWYHWSLMFKVVSKMCIIFIIIQI